MVGAFCSLLVVVLVQHGYHMIGGFGDWDLEHVDIICVYKYTDDVILIYIFQISYILALYSIDTLYAADPRTREVIVHA